MQTLYKTLPAFLLAACAGSTNYEGPPLPPSLLVPCDAPVELPERALSDQEIEVLWGRDRRALRECGGRFGAFRTILLGD